VALHSHTGDVGGHDLAVPEHTPATGADQHTGVRAAAHRRAPHVRVATAGGAHGRVAGAGDLGVLDAATAVLDDHHGVAFAAVDGPVAQQRVRAALHDDAVLPGVVDPQVGEGAGRPVGDGEGGVGAVPHATGGELRIARLADPQPGFGGPGDLTPVERT